MFQEINNFESFFQEKLAKKGSAGYIYTLSKHYYWYFDPYMGR